MDHVAIQPGRRPGLLAALLISCSGEKVLDYCPPPDSPEEVSLPACEAESPLLEEGFEELLTDRGGCGDLLFYAADPGRTAVLVFSVAGLAGAAVDAGEVLSCPLSLPHSEAGLIVKTGAYVASPCEEATGTQSTACTWEAVEGLATVDIASDGSAGSVILQEIHLERADGAAVEVAELAIFAAISAR